MLVSHNNYKVKIMGIGHRVYKTKDPRTAELKKMSQILCTGTLSLAALLSSCFPAILYRANPRHSRTQDDSVWGPVEDALHLS